MTQTPIYDATAPIACTATSEEIPVRIRQVEHMRTNLDRLERTAHGLLLHFPHRADVDAELRQFTVDEKRCCSFWGFDIETHDDQLTLRWDGPPDVDDFFEQLVAFFEGDEPSPPISGSSAHKPAVRPETDRRNA